MSITGNPGSINPDHLAEAKQEVTDGSLSPMGGETLGVGGDIKTPKAQMAAAASGLASSGAVSDSGPSQSANNAILQNIIAAGAGARDDTSRNGR